MARELTLTDLFRTLREVAGADESIDLDGEILDVSFTDLGYDSIALLEALGRIERETGMKIPESVMGDAETPRAFLQIVNSPVSADA